MRKCLLAFCLIAVLFSGCTSEDKTGIVTPIPVTPTPEPLSQVTPVPIITSDSTPTPYYYMSDSVHVVDLVKGRLMDFTTPDGGNWLGQNITGHPNVQMLNIDNLKKLNMTWPPAGYVSVDNGRTWQRGL